MQASLISSVRLDAVADSSVYDEADQVDDADQVVEADQVDDPHQVDDADQVDDAHQLPQSARSLRGSRLAKQDVVDEEVCGGDATVSRPLHLPGHLQHPLSVSEGNLSEQTSSKQQKHLVRSHAMCGDDDTRLRPAQAARSELSLARRQGSSNTSSHDSGSGCFTDSTGIDLFAFIDATLHKNNKDRQMLLQLENELRHFIVDSTKQIHRFPPMSSYNRMLVHRVAAFFGLDHNVDQSGAAVVVSRTDNTRIPDLEFFQIIRGEFFTDEPKQRHLRRDVQSYEEPQYAASDYLSVRHGHSSSSDYGGYRRARSFEVSNDGPRRTGSHYPPIQQPSTLVHVHHRNSFSSADAVNSAGHTIESPSSCSACETFGSENVPAVVAMAPWSSTDSYASSSDGPSNFASQQHLIARPPMVAKAGSFGGVSSAYRYNGTGGGGGMAMTDYHQQHLRSMPKRSNTDTTRGRSDCEREPAIPEHAPVEAVAPVPQQWSVEPPVPVMIPMNSQYVRYGQMAMTVPYPMDPLSVQMGEMNLDGRLWSPNLVVFPHSQETIMHAVPAPYYHAAHLSYVVHHSVPPPSAAPGAEPQTTSP